MAKFRFNLQTVLRYRKIMEDQRRREFAEASRLAETERGRLGELEAERSEVQDEIVRLYSERAPFQSVVDSYHMIGRLEGLKAASLERQRQLDQVVEDRRKVLVKARQETQIMETLREHRREEFVREQDQREQAIVDELSIQARGRRLREEELGS
ncbi:MAG: flagellar export protein FliJ [Planctomycetota bacterium]|jgi:flagellar FliJ protein|nr:flagellar export protein FliJ [Planctomycetota bacterium]